MTLTFKVVDVPETTAGRTALPNPFRPAAQAAVEAQEKNKAIAFELDLTGFADKKNDDGIVVKTATELAAAYVTRKVRELGKDFDRTFTVVVKDGVVTVAAKDPITRTKKSVADNAAAKA